MEHYNGSTDKETITQLKKINADLLESLNGLIDFIEIDKLAMDKDALKIARASIAKAKNGAA